MKPIKRILLPTDFSQNAAVALEMALHSARVFDAEIILLHVIELPSMTSKSAKKPVMLPTRYYEAVKARIMREIKKTQETIQQRGDFCIKAEFVEGIPFEEIVRAAKSYNVDMIVMGTHGHAGIIRTAIGSTAEKVLHKALCPVLTIKHPFFKFEMV